MRRLLAFLLGFGLSASAIAQEVAVPDKALAGLLRDVLARKRIEAKVFTKESLGKIYLLNGPDRGISNLEGLQHCVNLAELKLPRNRIKDLSPLAGCSRIQLLDLTGNQIQQLDPLRKLERLQYLKLDQNAIADVTPLNQLPALGSLYLDDNKLQSLQPLGELRRLHSLYVARNQLSDLRGLKNMKWLSNLDVSGNRISSVNELSSLTSLRFTFLQENQIRDISPLISMARRDTEGPRRFAPYWRLYLARNPVEDRSQLEALRELGVRLDTEYVHQKPQAKKDGRASGDSAGNQQPGGG